jgi:hypothetical protein
MLIASQATIFALIVGIFSIYNGRTTRREISRQIKDTSDKISPLIKETRKLVVETRNLIVAKGDKTRELIKVLKG